ncbi:hypothetical protein [Pseudomonas chlororaphis]|nr:hypothetical protein [Pseudomonas chlororaphis]
MKNNIRPRELFLLRLREHVMEPLKSHGFRFSASQLCFQGIGDFSRRIQFQLSQWSGENQVEFWSTWNGVSEWNIPGWSRDISNPARLLNRPEDAEVMVEFLRNALGPGLASFTGPVQAGRGK